MERREIHLGIVDWGIGGLSIYKQIKSRLGDIAVTYFSDTGVTPYGKMSRRQLIERLNDVLALLSAEGLTPLMVGCNAASTVLPILGIGGLKVAGVIESAVQVTAKMHPGRLALIGGRRTVLSGVYRRALANRGVAVKQRIAQPLSAFIENGDISSPELRDQCNRILGPLKHSSHLLLACTHYPAILPLLKEHVSQETVIIDPAEEVVKRIARWALPKGGDDRFLTSGEPDKMQIAASKAFDVELRTVERILI
jgi:glutamate racemase